MGFLSRTMMKSARQVPEAGSEVLSRVIAPSREVLTRGLMAGDDVLIRE